MYAQYLGQPPHEYYVYKISLSGKEHFFRASRELTWMECRFIEGAEFILVEAPPVDNKYHALRRLRVGPNSLEAMVSALDRV